MFGHVHKIHRAFYLVRGKHWRRNASGNHSLELLSSLDAAAMRVDDIFQFCPHRKLIYTGFLDMAADAEDLRSRAIRSPDLCVCLSAYLDDIGKIREGFDIVDNGWL